MTYNLIKRRIVPVLNQSLKSIRTELDYYLDTLTVICS